MDPRIDYDGDAIFCQYDAAGRMERTWRYYNAYETLLNQDGAGAEAKRSQRTWDTEMTQWKPWETVYFINSSVLGRTVSEATKTGKKKFTYVIGAGGSNLARQAVSTTDVETVEWQITDASGLSSRGFNNEELDALGNNVGMYAVPSPPDRTGNGLSPNETLPFTDMGMGDCQVNGTFMPCSMAQMMGDGMAGLGDFSNSGSFFSRGTYLPIEATGRIPYAKNNPLSIAHEALRDIFPSSITQMNYESGHHDRTIDSPLFRFNETLLSYLLGQQGAKTVKNNIQFIISAAKKAVELGEKDANGFSCADVFGSKALEYLEAYAKSIGNSGALRFGEKTADGEKLGTAYAGTSPFKKVKVGKDKYSVISINTKNEFFESSKYGFTGNAQKEFGHLSFEQFWAATLLHEIGHALKNAGEGSFIDPDAGDPAKSVENFRFVVKNCFAKPKSTSNGK